MKAHSLFRQPRKLAAVTFLTAFYVALVYVSTWYFSYVCDAVSDAAELPGKIIRMVVIYMEIVKALLRLQAQGKSILLLDEPYAGIPQGCAAEIKEGFLRDDRVSMIWISHTSLTAAPRAIEMRQDI